MDHDVGNHERLTAFERRERLLGLVREQPGIRVLELARRLGVSQGTIRNDLTALDQEHRLLRVRGGAVPTNGTSSPPQAFVSRTRVNELAKQRIAQSAAELISDGDSIFCDASSTVYHVAAFLEEHRRLTVITNGIEIGLKLAQNPSNTVILIGGVLRGDGAITRSLGDQMLEDLHIKLALVSGTGFAPDVGLAEDDLEQAQLKSKLVSAAQSVVALVDSTKFGKLDLRPFARTDQITHILTDSDLDPSWIQELQRTSIILTVCGEDQVSTFSPDRKETRHFKIGFANLSEQLPFALDVRRGLERAAHNAGNIDLITADNQLNGQVALQVAERFLNEGIDLMIEYQIDGQVGNVIMAKFREAGIPVIACDIPMVGATYFGVDNYRAGYMAGEALGHWVALNWDRQFDRVVILEEARPGALPAGRIRGQLDGLQALVGEIPPDKIIRLDCGNTREISEANMSAALENLPNVHRIVVISFNDDAAVGALDAARAHKREQEIIVVGQGADRLARAELRHPHSRLVGSTAYAPEKYGEGIIKLAQRIIRSEPVPPAIYTEHVFITAENLSQYYPDES